MALLRGGGGKLFAGALFAGALFNSVEAPVTPPDIVIGSAGGHSSYRGSRFYELKQRDETRIIEVRNTHEDEEETVVLFVLTELYRQGIL